MENLKNYSVFPNWIIKPDLSFFDLGVLGIFKRSYFAFRY